jgi:DNA repair protein RecN (Recombination protein N)
VRRVISKDRKSKSFLNDVPVTTAFLNRLSFLLMEIHGQFDDYSFFQISTQRDILDQFVHHPLLLEEVHRAWKHWQECEKKRQTLEEDLKKSRQQEDYLRHVLTELEKLNPVEGEEDELSQQRSHMIAIEKNAGTLQEMIAGLSDGQSQSVDQVLYGVIRQLPHLEALLGEDNSNTVATFFQQAIELFEQGRQILEKTASTLEFDPQILEKTEERLFALRAAARKHHTTVSGLIDLYSDLKNKVFNLEHAEECLKEAQKLAEKAQAIYYQAATALSASRQEAQKRFDPLIQQEITALHLEKARFQTMITPCDPQSEGIDRVVFEASTNPQSPFAPLHKVASGGELSRFLLAIKVVLSDTKQNIALIFDEIDKGVGGATADAVGKHLAHLSKERQVIAITHSPQVAARGNTHLHLQKRLLEDETVCSEGVFLTIPERIEELARMLAGQNVTEEAKAAARALLHGMESSNPL